MTNEAYGTDVRQKMNVYLPKDRDINTKVILQIHGGAWVFGDKSADGMADIRYDLLEEGYAVATMNYRYGCGDFNKQMEDVKLALEYIATQSGNWDIGGNKYGLMGVSAGGHMALLYAHGFDNENVVKAVVSLVGPTDLADPLFAQYVTNNNLTWAVEQLMGTSLAQDTALYKQASPIYYHKPVPTHFIYGYEDNLVPYQHGVRMYDTLTSYNIIADTTIFPNAGHNVDGPNGIYKDEIISETISWFNQYIN